MGEEKIRGLRALGGGAHEREVHLVADLLETALDDGQGDRIEGGGGRGGASVHGAGVWPAS